MRDRLRKIRIISDFLLIFLGVALLLGAWFVLGIAISAIHLHLIKSLGISILASSAQTAFLDAGHGFDSYRLFFSAIGLLLIILGCYLLKVDARI